jgi:photosystem II stability/assembly factor-like uncharacterized protein
MPIKLRRGIWESISSGFSGVVNWLIGADSGKLWVSQTGTTYSEITSPFGTSDVNDVGYLNNEYWAAGNDGKLAKSTDGLTWSTINTSQSTAINSVAYGNGLYYIGGV